jgi:polygalacturonase
MILAETRCLPPAFNRYHAWHMMNQTLAGRGLRVLFFGLGVAGFSVAGTAADAVPKAWQQVPAILKRIVPPVFPDREFVVTNFGAAGDGTTDCTRAFADAIGACHQAGGGRVVVPAGTFLSGAIHLQSHVNLHLAREATIKFSTDPKKFLPVVFSRDVAEMMNYSPFVYAFEQENVAITGEGTLDGQATKSIWPEWVKQAGPDAEKLTEMGDREIPVAQRVMGKGHFIRPNFVELVRCRNVLIEGIRVVDSPMWELHPLYCTNVTVHGVSVSSHGKNNDGCDPDSCTDVLIKDCVFDTGDDCIAVKAGRDHDGRQVNIPCQNVVIQNCTFKDGHGGITLGSETAGGLRHVFTENCEFDSPNLDQAMRFKTNPARGGFIEDIYIRNCRVKTARFGIYMTMRYASSGAKDGDAIPTVRNIDIRDCSFATLTKQPIVIEGWSPVARITDVTIANCRFPANANSNTITNAARIHIVGRKTDDAQ